MTRELRGGLLACALGGVLGLACAHAPPDPTVAPMCGLAVEAPAGAPPAEAVIALVLRGLDPVTRRLTLPPLDCTGTQIRWDGPVQACADSAIVRTLLPDRPIGPGDVVTAPVGGGRSLVWIATSRYASGDAVGPVAIVESGWPGLRVVARGVLRAYPEKLALRLERLGGEPVLVAEGESCSGTAPTTCRRAARLMTLRAGRFEPLPVATEDGACLAPGWFDLTRVELQPVEGAWQRLTLNATLTFGPRGLEVEEAVVVESLDRPDATRGPVLRRAQQLRSLRWVGGRLVGTEPALWSRLASGTR